MHDLKERFNKLSGRWKFAIVAVAVLLAAPFAYAALMGTLAIITLAIAFVIVSAAITFAPVLAMKLANWQLKAVIDEATRNPIETKWNIYQAKMAALEKVAENIERFSALILKNRNRLAALQRDYPNDPRTHAHSRFVDQMQQLKAMREDEYRKTIQVLQRYKRAIETDQAFWEASMEARDLKNAAGQTKLTALQDFADKAASNAVENEVNAMFAQLDRVMMERVEEPEPVEVQAIEAPSEETLPPRTVGKVRELAAPYGRKQQ